jgi:predicted amidohydrolase YtcJ
MFYKHVLIVILSAIAVMLFATAPADAFAGQNRKAFINAAVYTMDQKRPWAEAVVIDGNRIIYVGDTKTAKKIIDKKTQVFDLGGRMMLPGFIESHFHPAMGSMFASLILLNSDSTEEQVLSDIKKGLDQKKEDEAVGFMGFKGSAFGPEGPKASDLDAIEKDKPVIVFDYGGHSLWVNSKALQIAGITKDTPDPLPGGHYYKRDKDGNPTGWCIEPMAFMPIILSLGITPEDIINAQKKLFPKVTEFGFTAVFDAGSFMEEEMFKSYTLLEKQGDLTFRVYGCHMIANQRLLPGAIDELARLNRTYNTRLLKVNVMKIVNDGTIEAFSAGMFDGYLSDKENRGFELLGPDVLSGFVRKVDDAGWNVHIHAIGNRTISDALTAFENLKKEKGLTPTRKTICHTQLFMPDTVRRFADLNEVVAQTTPVWMVRDSNTEAAVGKELYERQMLFSSLDKAGVRVTFGSDFPVSSGMEGLNPFNEIEVGHTRRNIGDRDSNFLPPADERMPISTLLRGYTINGAYQLGVEKDLGSIEVGKLADLIVIEKNIFKQKPSDIHNNRVLMTVMDGDVVYKASKQKEKKNNNPVIEK